MEINAILIVSFKKWLKTLDYAQSTIYTSVNFVNDFFFYLKSLKIESLQAIQPTAIISYHKHLKTRPLKKRPGGLSQNTIVCNINAIKLFSRYLQETGKPFFEIPIKTKPNKETPKTILTPSEIKALYKACDNRTTELAEVLSIRDSAILSVYYGCGLRRSEGVSLDTSDILLKEKRIHVRSGKGYKERYVPITEAVREDLENYIYIAREQLLKDKTENEKALFLNVYGKRISGNSIMERLHQLTKKAKIEKNTGLHTLRHSIATHLLQSGLTLEEVSQFLGHSSLESTQIYTHIVNAEL